MLVGELPSGTEGRSSNPKPDAVFYRRAQAYPPSPSMGEVHIYKGPCPGPPANGVEPSTILEIAPPGDDPSMGVRAHLSGPYPGPPGHIYKGPYPGPLA